ncbi:hypothetical protein ARTHROSP310_02040 [Arthrobacter sp. AD-310]
MEPAKPANSGDRGLSMAVPPTPAAAAACSPVAGKGAVISGSSNLLRLHTLYVVHGVLPGELYSRL